MPQFDKCETTDAIFILDSYLQTMSNEAKK